MKTRVVSLVTLALWMVLGGVALFSTGCATADPDNASARPWNSPRGWESGALPSVLTDPRR